MKQKYKELLLKDLCTRLPYGVICQVTFDEDNIFTETIESVNMKYINQISTSGSSCGVECIKPYLRPMSSMTEEESIEYFDTFEWAQDLNGGNYPDKPTYKTFDWLNKKYFDYRTIKCADGKEKTMIELGLALEAPEGMYNLEKK